LTSEIRLTKCLVHGCPYRVPAGLLCAIAFGLSAAATTTRLLITGQFFLRLAEYAIRAPTEMFPTVSLPDFIASAAYNDKIGGQ